MVPYLLLLILLDSASLILAEIRSEFYEKLGQTLGGDTDVISSSVTKMTDVLECSVLCLKQDCKCFTVALGRGQPCSVHTSQQNLSLGTWEAFTSTRPGKVLIVKRTDDSENFYRSWADYKAGFGDPTTNYWIGLDTLHTLTNTGYYGLRVEMTDWNGTLFWAFYETFLVGTEPDNYRLSVSGFVADCSTVGDSLTVSHDGMQFSTHDNDNDAAEYFNCAANHKGGWWYRACQDTQPTGVYLPGGQESHQGVTWGSVPGHHKWYSYMYMAWYIVPN